MTLDRDGRKEVVRAEYLVGAGGGHSVTRHSMQEHLDGETYGGRYIVADIKLGLPCPPGRGRVVVGPDGFVLISPLPEGRFLIFVNRDEADENTEPPSEAELAALLNARVGTDVGMTDLRWISYFLAQRRVVRALGDGRRFLLGDAGHLSSPMGGEGINSALMDAADIAWKLALVLRGAATPTLLETYAIERELADRHALEVTNEIHDSIMQLVKMCAGGGTPSLPSAQDPAEALAGLRKRSMLDVSYLGSPLVDPGSAAAGGRFADGSRLTGASHHLVVFGDAPRLDDFRARWGALVPIVDGREAGLDPARAGLPARGAILVRPDGFVGFRRASADEAAIKALDAHLATYLRPNFTAADESSAGADRRQWVASPVEAALFSAEKSSASPQAAAGGEAGTGSQRIERSTARSASAIVSGRPTCSQRPSSRTPKSRPLAAAAWKNGARRKTSAASFSKS